MLASILRDYGKIGKDATRFTPSRVDVPVFVRFFPPISFTKSFLYVFVDIRLFHFLEEKKKTLELYPLITTHAAILPCMKVSIEFRKREVEKKNAHSSS